MNEPVIIVYTSHLFSPKNSGSIQNPLKILCSFPKYIRLLVFILFRLSVISLSIHDKVLREKYAQSIYTYIQYVRYYAVS